MSGKPLTLEQRGRGADGKVPHGGSTSQACGQDEPPLTGGPAKKRVQSPAGSSPRLEFAWYCAPTMIGEVTMSLPSAQGSEAAGPVPKWGLNLGGRLSEV